VATKAELEAAIEKDPTDEDAYLVYGDWLQGEDDARGELIALQAASLRDPGDKKAAQRAAKYLAEHGELACDLGKSTTVTWHLGFVRDVRFAAGDAKKAAGKLRDLLAHPAGRFVQSISVEPGAGFDPEDIVALLAREKRPATLAELRLGPSWDLDTHAPELKALFPRLARSVDLEWQRIAGELAEHKKLDLQYDPDMLPALVAEPDIDVGDIDNDKLVLGLRAELDKKRDLGVLAAMRRSFTRDSLDRWVTSLAQQWDDAGATTPMRWGFLAMGPLGDALAVAWIAKQLETWSHQRAVQGAELLGKIGTGAAMWELYTMISNPRIMRPRRADARGVLARLAEARGLGVDALLDRNVPAAAMREAPAKKGKAPADPLSEAITRRLQEHMVDGRRIPDRDFVHHFVGHPLVAPIARRLVWATYDNLDVEATFRIDETGAALDAGGDPVDLSGARIGVLHPAELPAADRRGVLKEWGEVFSDEGLVQPFPQLARPVHELREQERGDELVRWKLRNAGFGKLRDTFEDDADWTPDTEDTDGGAMTIGWNRFFARDGAEVSAAIAEGAIGSVTVTKSGKRVPFTRLHPATLSELIWTLERATARPGAAATASSATADDDTAAPASEIAKGTRVRVTRGPGSGSEGVVFWLGDGNRGARCGLKTDDGETVWADLDSVRDISAANAANAGAVVKRRSKSGEAATNAVVKGGPAAKPLPPVKKGPPEEKIAKGSQVRWNRGRLSGTGAVFWIGQNKFGDGIRVGLKDDETGETVWADANDCSLVD
jgi:uncharacterized protein (TIGR02996 family)